MSDKHYIFWSRCCKPIDRGDVIIAKICLFAVKFMFFLIIAVWVLLFLIV